MSGRVDRDTWHFSRLALVVARKSDYLAAVIAGIERGESSGSLGASANSTTEPILAVAIGRLPADLFLTPQERNERRRLYHEATLDDLDRVAIWNALEASLRGRD